jgi:hypothetical protein
MARVKDEAQTGFDEEVFDDPELEQALEEREKRKASAGAVAKLYQAADELAKAELARLELEDGDVARVGRFRITKSAIPGRSVTFDTKPSSRLRIGLVGEDAGKPVAADDEQDLRPKGEVNVDALRGDAERSIIPEPTQLRPGGRNAGRNAQRGPLPPVN